MMCWSRLTPSVAELSCPNGETCSHVCIAKGKDRTILSDTLCSNKFKMTVFILRNSKICNISDWRIKLRQISAARLAMKNINETTKADFVVLRGGQRRQIIMDFSNDIQ